MENKAAPNSNSLSERIGSVDVSIINAVITGFRSHLISQGYRSVVYDKFASGYSRDIRSLRQKPTFNEPVVMDEGRVVDEVGNPILKIAIRDADDLNGMLDEKVKQLLGQNGIEDISEIALTYSNGTRVYELRRK